MTGHRIALSLALLALVLLYGVWFCGWSGAERDWAALVVFGLPPLLLAGWARIARSAAPFWAGVLALFWFSHGVMVAWSRPSERALALAEVALAVAVVILSALPGLRARMGSRQRN